MTPNTTKRAYSQMNPQASSTAVIGSMTAALKARRALSAESLYSDVVKVSSHHGGGCEYGVRFSRAISGNVSAILAANGINVKYYE